MKPNEREKERKREKEKERERQGRRKCKGQHSGSLFQSLEAITAKARLPRSSFWDNLKVVVSGPKCS